MTLDSYKGKWCWIKRGVFCQEGFCCDCQIYVALGKTAVKVAELRRQNPQMKTIRIAEQLFMSKQRVSKLLQKLGLPTKIKLPSRFCIKCGKQIARGSKTGLCFNCLKEANLSACWVTLTCEVCGKQFKRYGSQWGRAQKVGYKHIFCNRKCHGKWLGKHYGRGRKVYPGMKLVLKEWETGQVQIAP